jgi:hypothetical protein
MKLGKSIVAIASVGLFATALSAQNNRIVFNSLADLDKCANQYSWDTGVCLEALQTYSRKHPKENFAIAKRARVQFKHWAALQFFEPALGKAPTAAQCGDEDLQLAVLSGIALPASHDTKPIADRVFAGPCFSALRPAIEKAVNESGGAGYMWQNGCAALAAKGVKLASCSAAPVVATAAASAVPTPMEKLPNVNLTSAKIGVVKVYRGTEGERVTIADLPDAKGAFAIRFDGVRSAWNGKTLVHRETTTGNNRLEYWTDVKGERWVSVHVSGGGARQYELFLPDGKGAIPLSYSDKDTQATKAETLRN